jgi:2-hydroxychromene-2-carboxylate isomerase
VERPRFYYNVASPWCYLAGERVNHALGTLPIWEPVLLPDGGAERDEVERAAASQGVAPIRWPEPFPFDGELAMLAATFARQTGRTVAFSLAAMRQAFAAGRDLSVPDNVLIAAAACELHPRAVLKAIETSGVREALRAATAEARERGIGEVPAIAAGAAIFTGPGAVEDAAALLAAASA